MFSSKKIHSWHELWRAYEVMRLKRKPSIIMKRCHCRKYNGTTSSTCLCSACSCSTCSASISCTSSVACPNGTASSWRSCSTFIHIDVDPSSSLITFPESIGTNPDNQLLLQLQFHPSLSLLSRNSLKESLQTLTACQLLGILLAQPTNIQSLLPR